MSSGIGNIIMIVETSDFLHRYSPNQLTLFSEKLHNSIEKSLVNHQGKIRENDDTRYVVNFKTATDSILCGLRLKHKFRYTAPKINEGFQELKIAISDSHSEVEAIKFASFLCENLKYDMSITDTIQKHYFNENQHIKIDRDRIEVISKSDEDFLKVLLKYLGENWSFCNLSISQLEENLNYSYGQIYSKIKNLSGKTPSNFIRDYRLRKTLMGLRKKNNPIATIAKNNGFSSNSYFSTSFKARFGITPQEYSNLEA